MSKSPFDRISLCLTDKLFNQEDKQDTASVVDEKTMEIKRAKVYYSINLILNELSKLIILGLIAGLLNIFLQYLFCLVVLLLTRSILGGLHGKSYLECLLLTAVCVGLTVYGSPHIIVNVWIEIAVLAIWCILAILVGPIQSKNRLRISEKKKRHNKIYLVIVSIFLFFGTLLLGQIYIQMYCFLLLFQMMGLLMK